SCFVWGETTMMDILSKIKPEMISLLIYLQMLKWKNKKQVKVKGETYNLNNPKDVERLENILLADIISQVLSVLEKNESK
ncbi:MAG: hypothetical protein N2053_13380, partial [Chitinispirillaceae bacterium]|nr:hypothetical protein [Chitinispirillaceae bacterium]